MNEHPANRVANGCASNSELDTLPGLSLDGSDKALTRLYGGHSEEHSH